MTMKKIFVIDWSLLPCFVLSAFTGLELHVHGQGADHALWHNWAVAHIVVSLLFLVLAVWHVRTHIGWYKSLLRQGLGKKSRVTVIVSALFAVLALSGLALLAVEGPNSGLGLWHYRLGLAGMLLFAGHIIKRTPLLRRSLSTGK